MQMRPMVFAFALLSGGCGGGSELAARSTALAPTVAQLTRVNMSYDSFYAVPSGRTLVVTDVVVDQGFPSHFTILNAGGDNTPQIFFTDKVREFHSCIVMKLSAGTKIGLRSNDPKVNAFGFLLGYLDP